jgi:hypothetical protein
MRAIIFPLNLLSLALLVFRVAANYADNAAAMDDLAFVANRFDACSYFHVLLLSLPTAPASEGGRYKTLLQKPSVHCFAAIFRGGHCFAYL